LIILIAEKALSALAVPNQIPKTFFLRMDPILYFYIHQVLDEWTIPPKGKVASFCARRSMQ
jgi:hypothetical protein